MASSVNINPIKEKVQWKIKYNKKEYTIEEELHRGAFSTIYKGFDIENGKDYIFKVHRKMRKPKCSAGV